MGHSLLSAHAYKLGLNDSPFYSLHDGEFIGDLLLFNCPSLSIRRLLSIDFLKSLNIPFGHLSILDSRSELVICSVIQFVLDAGFVI